MAETVAAFLQAYFPPELAVFIISMLPILELRGGLIAASFFGIPWAKAAWICVLGNIIPVPFILLFIKKIFALLKKTKLFYKLASRYEEKGVAKSAEIIEKYPRRIQWALYLFVAIPLPMTGAWTGSLIAAFLDLKIKKSFPFIALGVLTAAVIMLILAYLLPSLVGLK